MYLLFLFSPLSPFIAFPPKRFDWSNDLPATEHPGPTSVFLSSASREVTAAAMMMMAAVIMTPQPDYGGEGGALTSPDRLCS